MAPDGAAPAAAAAASEASEEDAGDGEVPPAAASPSSIIGIAPSQSSKPLTSVAAGGSGAHGVGKFEHDCVSFTWGGHASCGGMSERGVHVGHERENESAREREMMHVHSRRR